MPPTIPGPIAEGGWTSRSRAWFTTDGVFRAEFDPGSERPFSWTGKTGRLIIPNLDRSYRYRLSLQVSALRPPETPLPQLRVSVDGTALREVALRPARQEIWVGLPTSDRDGAVVTIDLSNTFVPRGDDDRALGAIVHGVGLTPAGGHFRPTGRVLALGWLAAFAAIVGILLCGLSSRMGITAAAVVAIAFAWLLLQDGAFMGLAVERFVAIGLGTAVVGAFVGLLGWRWPAIGGVPDWRIAAGIALCASTVKLALFGHPLATVGDGIFQVHRAAMVHGGQYFFTSVTPRPFFEFPYPIALYVSAQPFWRLFPTELDLLFLLRILTLSVDALVGVTFYGAARRQWDNRSAALFCALLWPLARAPIEVLSNANLTNAFGQAMFGVAMGAFLWGVAGGWISKTAIAVATLLMTTAFLSHFGTATVGACILGAVGLTLVATPGRTRRIGLVLVGVGIAAAAIAYVVYYSHFHAVYGETITRLMSQPDAGVAGKLVAPPSVKARLWWDGRADDFAPPRVPVLVAAVAGAVLLARRRPRDVLSVVLLVWIAVWAGFSALGLLTPISMRMNLATTPAFVCLSAYALGSLAGTSRAGAVLAAVGAVLFASDGVRMCLVCLGLTPAF
jgi:hypothetical protein